MGRRDRERKERICAGLEKPIAPRKLDPKLVSASEKAMEIWNILGKLGRMV